jgi:hypothetical protein
VSTPSATPNDKARYRARRQAAQPLPLVRYRRPAARHSRPQRWHDALPEGLRDSALVEALQAIVELDLDALAGIVPPHGYGRN